MLAGFKFARGLANHEPFKGVVAKEVSPGPSVSSDEDIIRKYSIYGKRDVRRSLTLFQSTLRKTSVHCGVSDYNSSSLPYHNQA